MVLIKTIAYAAIPFVMAAWGTHLALKNVNDVRRGRLIAGFWLLAAVGTVLVFFVERNSEGAHKQEVAALNKALSSVQTELSVTRSALTTTRVENAHELGILEGRVQDLSLLLRQGNPSLEKFAKSVEKSTKTLAQIEAKSSELREHRGDSKYSSLTNLELRNVTLKFVNSLRKRINQEEREADAPVYDVPHRKRLQLMRELNYDYESRFETDAILLSNELVSRIHVPITRRRDFAADMYEHPTNPLGMKWVAEDLEYLAGMLSVGDPK